jgi:hypothetical protein
MPKTPAQTLNDVRAERIVVTQSVPFFLLASAETSLAPVGTVTVVAGLENSALFKKVEAALVASDTAALNSALREASAAEGEAQPIASEEHAVKVMDAQPAFADVRFLTRTLVSNVFVTPEVDFVRYYLPFAGGRLEPQDFQVAYFLKSEDAPKFKALVVVTPPKLSDDEASLVNNIPAASREMLVGEGPVGLITTTITVTTVAAVAYGIAYGIGRATQHWPMEASVDAERKVLDRQGNASSSLKDLTPTSTVQNLLAAKREALALLAKS